MEVNKDVENPTKHYRILFTFPSHRAIVTGLFLISVFTGFFAYLLAFGFDFIIDGALFGLVALFLPLVLGDLIVSGLILRGHRIFNLRRTSALSLFTVILWAIVLILSSVAQGVLGIDLLMRGFVFGFSLVLSLRVLCFVGIIDGGVVKKFFASTTPPTLCLFAAFLWAQISTRLIVLGIASASVMGLFVFTGIIILNILGVRGGRGKLTSLFWAFASVWMEDEVGPLERVLEEKGVKEDIPIQMLGVRGSKLRALVIAPAVHFGPFRSVGSSSLPSIVTERISSDLGCPALVLHTIVGHDLDLTSQDQCDKVVGKIMRMSKKLKEFTEGVTPIVRVGSGDAKATCQILGKCALITLTMAPKTTEDLPRWIEKSLSERARSLGLHTIVVDAHNSLREGEGVSEEDARGLLRAATQALEKAVKMPRHVVRIGAAHTDPRFSLEDGMGKGGISVLVIRLRRQAVAYVLIDGNNMVSGIRERIQESLRDLGIYECEVLTTDTHTVNAMGSGGRGYPLLGERIPLDEIVKDVKTTAKSALEGVREAKVMWAMDKVKVKVIGDKLLQNLSDTVDWGVQSVKKLLLFTYSTALIVSFFIVYLL